MFLARNDLKVNNYSNFGLKSQENFIHTHLKKPVSYKDCKPHSRCNNHKKCKHCAKERAKREFSKATKHLKEDNVSHFKHKYFIEFNTKENHKDHKLKNLLIDSFIDELIKSKRSKNSILYESEYFTSKHISYTNKMGYNPHYHMILLSDKSPKHNKQLKKLMDRYNIKVHYTKIYKEDKKFITSIEKMINYCLKVEDDRIQLEQHQELTKNKKDIRKSNLFKYGKFTKLHKHLYKHIARIKHNKAVKDREARKVYRRYLKRNPKLKPHTKIKMIKSLKKKLERNKKSRDFHLYRLSRRFAPYF